MTDLFCAGMTELFAGGVAEFFVRGRGGVLCAGARRSSLRGGAAGGFARGCGGALCAGAWRSSLRARVGRGVWECEDALDCGGSADWRLRRVSDAVLPMRGSGGFGAV